MPTKVKIIGDNGEYIGKVTHRGQVVTAPLEYNTPIFRSLTVINTAYNFVTPIAGKAFVIDGYIVSSDKGVSSTNGATINIYEANSDSSIVIQNSIFTLDLGRLDGNGLTSLNVISNAGVWINAKTNDNTCNVTLLGYYVNIEVD